MDHDKAIADAARAYVRALREATEIAGQFRGPSALFDFDRYSAALKREGETLDALVAAIARADEEADDE